MANKKFSQFTNQPSSSNTFLVGYDGTTNVRIPESDSIFKKGHEPYVNAVLTTAPEVMNQIGGEPTIKTDCNLGEKEAICAPMMFQQDVKITKAMINQTNTSTNSSEGLLGIYKFNSIVIDGYGSEANAYIFDKVYQDSTTFDLSSSLANSLQEITLATPQTLNAGSVYVIMIAFETLQSGTSPKFLGYESLAANKFLGSRTLSSSIVQFVRFSAAKYPPVKGAPNVDIVNGVLPNEIQFGAVFSNFAHACGFVHFTVENV